MSTPHHAFGAAAQDAILDPLAVAIGMGCDRGVSLATVQEALAQALAQCGRLPRHVRLMASIDAKRDEEALLALAAAAGWPCAWWPAARLAQVSVPNPSPTVLRFMGTPSVSEAAALLAAGSRDSADLLVEKIRHRGPCGKHATVSVACWRGGPGPGPWPAALAPVLLAEPGPALDAVPSSRPYPSIDLSHAFATGTDHDL